MTTTQKQNKFAVAYVRCGNATKSYIEAYKPKTTNDNTLMKSAHRVLHNARVQEKIKTLNDATAESQLVTVDRVLKEYAKIAFTDLPGIIDYKHGKMTIEDFDNLTPAQRGCIKEFKFKTDYKIVDKSPVPVNNVEFKLYDKQHALDMLGKHMGMFVEKSEVEHSGETTMKNVVMSKDEYEQARDKMIKNDDC